MYYIYGQSGPSLLIESTDSMIYIYNLVYVCSSKILIDRNGIGKIGDFGFCRELPRVDGGRTHVCQKGITLQSCLMSSMVQEVMCTALVW